MRRQAHMLRRAAAIAVTLSVWLAHASPVQSQNEGTPLDHLKCYQIHDRLGPAAYVADLRNQFGLEPGCRIRVPARLFCVESEKRILAPQPPGGGPSGTAAGHFLCYAVQCPTTLPIPATEVEDQFGRRTIAFKKERILCAPADKLLCGDGDLDPGEQCDPGSAATNVCPDGLPCNTDCTCPPVDVCCQCPDTCAGANGTICPPGCQPVVGAACIENVCQSCSCGDECVDAAGNVGICRQTDPASPLCECIVPPCECGAPCTTSAGQSGRCTQVPGSADCSCQPPEQCPCGVTCTTPDGQVGECRPSPMSNICECMAPPNPCPCGTTCTTPDGQVGECRPNPMSDVCECMVPPDPCPCGTTCTTPDGAAGLCEFVAGSNQCRCQPTSSTCPCGKPCVGPNGLAGRCRPLRGSPGTCACAEG